MSKHYKLKEIIELFFNINTNGTFSIGNNKVKINNQVITLDEMLKQTQEYPQIQAFLSTYFACFHMEQYLNNTTFVFSARNSLKMQPHYDNEIKITNNQKHFQELNIDSAIPNKEKHYEMLKQQVEWIKQQPIIEIEDDDFQVVNLNETRKQD